MNRNDRTVRLGSLVLALALLAPLMLGYETQAAKEQQTISGQIKRAEITPTGEVRRVYIEDAEGESYLVVRRGVGKELLTRSHERVSATGYVSRSKMDQDFKFVIEVMEYAILEDEPTTADEAPAQPITGQ